MSHPLPCPPPHRFSTLCDLLRYAVSRFTQARLCFGHGTTNAYDEAVYLVLHTLHLPLDTLDPFLDAHLLDTEIAAVLRIVERRASERVPAAYLTHEAWMHGYRFYVDERVIVPRSLIGELLRERLQPWVEAPDDAFAALDLCTGSGCLAILAADAFPKAQIDAVDLSAEALEVARRNVADYELDARVTLYRGDLFEPLPARRYDLIISNPPYVSGASMRRLPAEYRHEPGLALAGGEDGMDLVRRIVIQARQWLTSAGLLIVEVGHERKHVEAAFGGLDVTWLSTSAGDDSIFLVRAVDLPGPSRGRSA